jgi:predicted Fe-Mo cluster-binding NifX family protein
MRICIPTETDVGRKAIVYAHFGSAPYFTIYDSEKDTFEVIDNSNQHHAHGTCHPLEMLNDKHIDAVVCGGMGARAVLGLNGSGIKVYRVVGGTVEETIEKWKNGSFEEITAENACSEHKCH